MFTFIDMIVFCFVSVSVWSGRHGRSNRAGPVNHISSARRKPGVQTLTAHPTPVTHFLQQNSSS